MKSALCKLKASKMQNQNNFSMKTSARYAPQLVGVAVD